VACAGGTACQCHEATGGHAEPAQKALDHFLRANYLPESMTFRAAGSSFTAFFFFDIAAYFLAGALPANATNSAASHDILMERIIGFPSVVI
jgi:hypothetical protein